MSSSQTSSSSSDVVPVLPALYRPFAAVACDVDIVLGCGDMTLRVCMGLQKGSIVKLEQPAGADLALVVNGVTFGRGEVVIMDDAVSLRLTELVRPSGDGR